MSLRMDREDLLPLTSTGLRLLTLAIGIIDFGVTVDSYQHHYTKEEFFLSILVICLVLSAFFVLVALGARTGHLKRSNLMKIFDFSFHVFATLFLFIGAVLFLVSVKQFGSGATPTQRTYYGQRIASGALGIVNSLVYLNICWMTWFIDRPFVRKQAIPPAETEVY